MVTTLILVAGPPLVQSAQPVAPPVVLATDDSRRQEPDIDLFALMTGKCSKLRVAGHDYACHTVGFFHDQNGRANFTVALDDATDSSHIISFSGEGGQREKDGLYELPIDRMLLNSKDRPRVDGLPVPSVDSSTGQCKQFGNFAALRVTSIACSATDRNGKSYELIFESDGSPIALRRVRHSPLEAEQRRLKKNAQIGCRKQAYAAKVMPRDLTAYLIGCLGENGGEAAPANPK